MESIEKQQHPQHNTVMQDILECLFKLFVFYVFVAVDIVEEYAPDVKEYLKYLIYGWVGIMVVVLLICAFQGVKQLRQSESKYIDTETRNAENNIFLFEILTVKAIMHYVMGNTFLCCSTLIMIVVFGLLTYIHNRKKKKQKIKQMR